MYIPDLYIAGITNFRKFIFVFCTLSLILNLPSHSSTAQIEDLLEAGETGSVEAQNQLGDAYFSGNGTAKNLQQAFYWYEKAAEQGHVLEYATTTFRRNSVFPLTRVPLTFTG